MGENTFPSIIAPTASENRNMYSTAIQNGLSKVTASNDFQIMQIIPPFTKSMLANTGSLNDAYIQCAKSILKEFPQEVRSQITISRTFAQIREKTLHTLTVTSPPTVRTQYHSIRSRGLNLLGKTVFPMGKHILNKERNFYPRRYNIKFVNFPYVCSDTETLKLIELPEGIEHNPTINRMKVNIDGDFIFDGYATLSVTVHNANEEEKLRKWSYESKIADFKDWNGLEIKFHVPALHSCRFCEEKNRQYIGHHKDWCFLWQKGMHKVERQNRQNVNTEQKNTHLKTQETNPDNAQEQEMLDQDSFGNLTIDEEEIQETFVEEICSGSTESPEMCTKATESTKTTEQIESLSHQISTEKQSNSIMKSNSPNRLNSSNVEPLKGVVLKQYRTVNKQTQNHQRKQQNTEIPRHFLNTEWRKKKNELNNNSK